MDVRFTKPQIRMLIEAVHFYNNFNKKNGREFMLYDYTHKEGNPYDMTVKLEDKNPLGYTYFEVRALHHAFNKLIQSLEDIKKLQQKGEE